MVSSILNESLQKPMNYSDLDLGLESTNLHVDKTNEDYSTYNLGDIDIGWRQGAYGRPRQKVMINAGRRSRDLASRQEVTSRQEGRCHNIGRCQGHLEHLKMPGHLGDVTDVRTRSNEDIRMDGFHYLLSLWSTQIS
ncbi:hypothetical protein BM1_03965 [Bipolaris maydis]|nr:hypothetical protein BM1_03965 [Bipolaris maydis]